MNGYMIEPPMRWFNYRNRHHDDGPALPIEAEALIPYMPWCDDTYAVALYRQYIGLGWQPIKAALHVIQTLKDEQPV